MEPGYIVVLYSRGDDDPWIGNIRCKTKKAAEEIMKNLAKRDETGGLSIWIIEDFGKS